MSFYVYILESTPTKELIVGRTSVLYRVVQSINRDKKGEHADGIPWKSVFIREFLKEEEALSFELELKQLDQKELKQIIGNSKLFNSQ